jgi:hypothetical protein
MEFWKSTGLLNGVKKEEEEKELITMFDKALPLIQNSSLEKSIFSVIRRSYDLSGITDVEWLIEDFQKWSLENELLINNINNSVYMKLDGEVEIVSMYSDIHGNRYIKQHNLAKVII